MDSPPASVASVTLQVGQQGRVSREGVLADPLTPDEQDELTWYREEYLRSASSEPSERVSRAESLLVDVGERLYRALFGSAETAEIAAALLAHKGSRQINILSDIPAALNLPWELLHDGKEFMTLSEQRPVGVVRCPMQVELVKLSPLLKPPLRVLFIAPRPEGIEFTDHRSVATHLLDKTQDLVESGALEFEFLYPSTLRALRKRLVDESCPPIDVLHFDGHGTLESENNPQGELGVYNQGRGLLVFEDSGGRFDQVGGDTLAQVLQNRSLRLILLTSSQSAVGVAEDAFNSISLQLLRAGVGIVTGQNARAWEPGTAFYAETFYRALLKGEPVVAAHQRAQQTLFSGGQPDAGATENDLSFAHKEWWTPRLYLQQPLALADDFPTFNSHAVAEAPNGGKPSLEHLPAEPLYGFWGRARELWQIENILRRQGLVVIHGMGGVGKTALAREASAWLTQTGMFDKVCFFPFQQDGDADLFLNALGKQLKLSYPPDGGEEERGILRELARRSDEQRLLVVVDGLSHMLSSNQYQADSNSRTRLLGIISALVEMKVSVIVTSRDASSIDKSAGERLSVAYLPLEGLSSDDAFLFATRGPTKFGFGEVNSSYGELKELLSQLDHHPLPIQVILPFLRLGRENLAALKKEVDASLQHYTDDSSVGLSRALQVSLNIIQERLGEESWELLSALRVFKGVISKDAARYITQMTEEQWTELSGVLVLTGLLMPLQIDGVANLYFSLHSVLTSRPDSMPSGANAEPLLKHYVEYYAAYARYLYNEDERRPRWVREMVLHELPDLRRALDILFDRKDFDTAFRMARVMEYFLREFGMKTALDRLLHKMAAAASKTDGRLTFPIYHNEMLSAGREFLRGDAAAAYTRASGLLARLNSQRHSSHNEPGAYEKFELLVTISYYLLRMNEPLRAEEMLGQAQAISKELAAQELGGERYGHYRLQVLRVLVPALAAQNKWDAAEEEARTALRLAEEAASIGQRIFFSRILGELAHRREDYEEARARYTQALELSRSQLESRETPYLWIRLGEIATLQAQWSEAERAFRESLEIFERWNRGPEVAHVFSKLAAVAEAVGRFAEAEGWYEKALAISIQLGNQEATADVLTRLATMIANEVQSGRTTKTRLSVARQYAEAALAGREKLLGGSHPATAQSLTTLGMILQTQGEPEGARPHLERALEINERVFGQKHPDTAQSLHNLAGLLQALGDSTSARPLLERALATYREIYGEGHPSTAQALYSMATLLRTEGDPAAAIPLLEHALKTNELHFDPASQEILLPRNDLGLLYYEVGKIKEAQSSFNYIFTQLSKKYSAHRKSRRAAEGLLGNLAAITEEMYTAGTSTSQRARTEALGRAIAILSDLAPTKIDILSSDQFLIERIINRWREVITRQVGRAGQRGILKEVASPYIFTAPVSGAALVGREDVFRRISSLWAHQGQRNSLLIHGHRRMGKTSVAQALATRCDFGADTELVYLSLEGQTLGEGEVYVSIALRLWRLVKGELKMPEMNEYVKGHARIRFDVFLADFNEKRAGMRVVLVMDEFELLYRRMGSKQAEEIIGHLRTQTQVYHWLALALVGLSDLEDLSLSYQSALLGWEPIAVSFLDASEVAKVLTNPAGDPDFPLDYSQEALNEIFTITNGQPYLVQVIGDLLVQHYNRVVFTEQREHGPIFNPADVHAVVNNPHFYATAAAYFQGVWGQATKGQPGEGQILKALAVSKNGLTEAELQSAAQIEGNTFIYARDSLKRHAVICPLDGRWHYTVPLMQRWVQENCLTTKPRDTEV